MMFLLKYLEESATLYPDKIALISPSGQFSYSTLLNDSRSVGQFLIDKNQINRGIIVFMEKEYLTLCAFLGIIYARNFYCLVNLDLPLFRIKKIKETLETKIVVTNSQNYQKCQEIFSDCQIYLVEEMINTPYNLSSLNKVNYSRLDIDPIYANFTSGSTGNPKGVLISNRSIVDFIETFDQTFNFSHDDIFANQAPWDFDVSTKDIYTSLKKGGTLLIVPRQYFSAPLKLKEYLIKHQPTVLIWAVSALCLITTFHLLDDNNFLFIKKVLFSGEVMPLKHLNKWLEKLPKTQFVNLYGPTEITCNCTYYCLDKKEYQNTLPIGKPFKNEEVFLVDNEDTLIVTSNSVGEILVKGSCLGLGYYNNLEETKKVFVQNPLNNKYLDLVYRTKDLAYYDKDGNLIFAGRKDFQIKYLGHRIELEEIESYISQIDGINRAIAHFNEEKNRLIAFYNGDKEPLEIIKLLKEKLPSYMIPSKLYRIAYFPLNKNGKVDRKELLKEVNL